MSSTKICAVIGICVVVVLSCGSEPTSPPAPHVPLTTLMAASELVSIDGIEYGAEIDPWRDFMPGAKASSNGKGLLALARICRSDSLAISEGLHLRFVWILFNDQVWGAELGEEQADFARDCCRTAMARGGPKWGPNVDVLGVIAFSDESGGLKLIRTPMARIVRTD